MKYSGIWAFSPRVIHDFLQKHTQKIDTAYYYKSCVITIEKLPKKKILNLPQTKITINGNEHDTKEIYNKLFLNFLSAGG